MDNESCELLWSLDSPSDEQGSHGAISIMPEEEDRNENQQSRYAFYTPDPITAVDVSRTPTATATIHTSADHFCTPRTSSLTKQLSISAPDTSSGTIIGIELTDTLRNTTPNDTPQLDATGSVIINNKYAHAVPPPMNVSEQGRGFERPEHRRSEDLNAFNNGLQCSSYMEGSMKKCKWKAQLFPQAKILPCAEKFLNYCLFQIKRVLGTIDTTVEQEIRHFGNFQLSQLREGRIGWQAITDSFLQLFQKRFPFVNGIENLLSKFVRGSAKYEQMRKTDRKSLLEYNDNPVTANRETASYSNIIVPSMEKQVAPSRNGSRDEYMKHLANLGKLTAVAITDKVTEPEASLPRHANASDQTPVQKSLQQGVKTIGLNNYSGFTRSLRTDLSNVQTLSRPTTMTEMVEKGDLFGERMRYPKGAGMKNKYPFQLAMPPRTEPGQLQEHLSLRTGIENDDIRESNLKIAKMEEYQNSYDRNPKRQRITIEPERQYVEQASHPETFHGPINIKCMNPVPDEEFGDGFINRYNNEGRRSSHSTNTENPTPKPTLTSLFLDSSALIRKLRVIQKKHGMDDILSEELLEYVSECAKERLKYFLRRVSEAAKCQIAIPKRECELDSFNNEALLSLEVIQYEEEMGFRAAAKGRVTKVQAGRKEPKLTPMPTLVVVKPEILDRAALKKKFKEEAKRKKEALRIKDQQDALINRVRQAFDKKIPSPVKTEFQKEFSHIAKTKAERQGKLESFIDEKPRGEEWSILHFGKERMAQRKILLSMQHCFYVLESDFQTRKSVIFYKWLARSTDVSNGLLN